VSPYQLRSLTVTTILIGTGFHDAAATNRFFNKNGKVTLGTALRYGPMPDSIGAAGVARTAEKDFTFFGSFFTDSPAASFLRTVYADIEWFCRCTGRISGAAEEFSETAFLDNHLFTADITDDIGGG
jgi:hypothetical protein